MAGVCQNDGRLEEPLFPGSTAEVTICNEALVQVVLLDEVKDDGKVKEGSSAAGRCHVPNVWVLDSKFEVGVDM